MTTATPLRTLVHASRRRAVANLALEQTTWAITLALAGLILLLIAGTQILSWVWPAALLTAGSLFGLFRLRGRLPSPYQVAQTLDARLSLRDLLSTAWHFEKAQSRSQFTPLVLDQAGQTAAAIHPADAVPLAWPRNGYWALGLVVLALATLGWRYGRLQTLDLRAPLVELRFDPFSAFTGAPPVQAKKLTPPGVQVPLDTSANSSDPLSPEQLPENALMSVPDPEGQGRSLANQAGEKRDGRNSNEQGVAEEGDTTEGSESRPGDNSADAPPAAKSQPQSGDNKPPPSSKETNSLLDKMRDALANLMDKLKTESTSQQQNASSQSGKQNTPAGQKGQKGQKSPGKDPSQGDPNSDAQAQAGQEASDQPGQKSAQSDPNASDNPSNQEKSGIGRQDGKKDTELAEQLDAMGKISEILGKRAQNLQGEMTVEVTTTKQQLRTPYVQRGASHAESGGEIHRDEVPLHLQQFVQNYYDQLRKQNPTPHK